MGEATLPVRTTRYYLSRLLKINRPFGFAGAGPAMRCEGFFLHSFRPNKKPGVLSEHPGFCLDLFDQSELSSDSFDIGFLPRMHSLLFPH